MKTDCLLLRPSRRCTMFLRVVARNLTPPPLTSLLRFLPAASCATRPQFFTQPKLRFSSTPPKASGSSVTSIPAPPPSLALVLRDVLSAGAPCA
jgi:hypothetical protein